MSASSPQSRPNPWRIDSRDDQDLLAPTAPDLSLQRPTTPGPQLPELQIDDESLAAALSDDDAFTTPRGSLDPPPAQPVSASNNGDATIAAPAPPPPVISHSSSFMRYFGGLRSSQSYRTDVGDADAGRPIKRSSSNFIASLSSQSQSGKGWWGPVVPQDDGQAYPRPSTTPRKPRQERQPSTVPSLFHQRLTGSGWFGPVVSPPASASRLPSSKPGHPFPTITSSSSPASPSSPIATTAAERESQRLEREARDAERLQSIRDGTAGQSRSARRPGLVKRLSSGVSMKSFSLAALKAPLMVTTRSQRSHTRSTVDETSQQAVATADEPNLASSTTTTGGPEEEGAARGSDDGQTWRPIGGHVGGAGAGWQGEPEYVVDAPVAQPPTLADVVEEPSPAATPSPRPASPPTAVAAAAPSSEDVSTPGKRSSRDPPAAGPPSPPFSNLSPPEPEPEHFRRDDRLAEEAW